MLNSLFDLRSQLRAQLVSGSALERIGLLAGTFFPLYLLAGVLMGALPPQWLGTLPAAWSAGPSSKPGSRRSRGGWRCTLARRGGTFRSDQPTDEATNTRPPRSSSVP
ncbi:hypothetical protein GGP66_003009 [Salinibacter ruber]|nr:hypothetical protein [Salinibacter ruber]